MKLREVGAVGPLDTSSIGPVYELGKHTRLRVYSSGTHRERTRMAQRTINARERTEKERTRKSRGNAPKTFKGTHRKRLKERTKKSRGNATKTFKGTQKKKQRERMV